MVRRTEINNGIAILSFPPEGTRRTLDATGVIHLGGIYREIGK